MSIRMQFLGDTVVFCVSVLAVINKDDMENGMFAFILIYSNDITRLLNRIVIVITEVDTNIVSVERLQEYICLPSEAKWRMEEVTDDDWPSQGKIEFTDVALRYQNNLDLVLKRITLCISPREKVGIIGRTGAGKSSLALGLLRIIEKDNGIIRIDGVDIATVGLHDLRSKLTIIPQDPVLFTGTVRMNIDPFEMYSDEDIWKSLECVQLKDFIESLENNLYHELSEGAENISVGQRQLICFSRALLRKTRILILDEATASIDVKTDKQIQRTIRTVFTECTILTIAHRLDTIMDYSRILVLEGGRISEFDTPRNLLSNHQSTFNKLARNSNLV